MPNISAPHLADHLDRCWDLYRHGRLQDIAAQLEPGRKLLDLVLPDLDETSRGNAEVELDMLGIIAGMVSVEGSDESFRASAELAERAAAPAATCDALHRLAAFAVGVHAAMRTGRLRAAELRFRQGLAVAQGLNADGGEPGVTGDDVCAVLGGAGLHLAGAAATAGDAPMMEALLEHSTVAAAELGREHEILGQYFGPGHVVATRAVCMAELQRFDEALTLGRSVDPSTLMPIVGATLLRTLAECSERLERRAAATALWNKAETLAPPSRPRPQPPGAGPLEA